MHRQLFPVPHMRTVAFLCEYPQLRTKKRLSRAGATNAVLIGTDRNRGGVRPHCRLNDISARPYGARAIRYNLRKYLFGVSGGAGKPRRRPGTPIPLSTADAGFGTPVSCEAVYACHWNQRSYLVPAIAAYRQFRFRSSCPWRSHQEQRCYD